MWKEQERKRMYRCLNTKSSNLVNLGLQIYPTKKHLNNTVSEMSWTDSCLNTMNKNVKAAWFVAFREQLLLHFKHLIISDFLKTEALEYEIITYCNSHAKSLE